ncbi:MAG: phosphatidylglycerophosphatase A [Deltaproteobacteria bacterium]|nr:phosphatidylglycerophosphatase A [Deltaproteobacteria bacterium]
MKKSIVKFLATGTYLGCAPLAPGTFGTIWGVGITWVISGYSLYIQGAVILAVILASIYVAGEYTRAISRHDHPSIVCDEISGYLVAFFALPFTLFNATLVFILFRIFDILKPYPAGSLDKKVKGGLGVVADDLAAGIYAGVSARLMIWLLG